MTMPETTQSDLVEQLEAWSDNDAEYGHHERSKALAQAAAEITRLKLDLRAAECLHDSQYKAGVKHGWNLCVAEDHDGFMRITGGTEHIAELKRIQAEREELGLGRKENPE